MLCQGSEVSMASNNNISEAKSPGKEGPVMAKTFNQMVAEAMTEVPVINPQKPIGGYKKIRGL